MSVEPIGDQAERLGALAERLARGELRPGDRELVELGRRLGAVEAAILQAARALASVIDGVEALSGEAERPPE